MSDNVFQAAKAATRKIAALSDGQRSEVLLAVADSILASASELLAANSEDLALMDPSNPLYDRLKLTEERLEGIAADMRSVASLPSPLGRTLADRTLPNGLRLRKVSVPFGTIGIIYEARPNVTFDVFSLCFKSGNVSILKGGRDADNSNRAAVALIRRTLASRGIPEAAVTLLPATHEAASGLLGAVGYVDLVIPRGGRRLIDFVRDNAKVPCIETGAGVVNTYFDAEGDLLYVSTSGTCIDIFEYELSSLGSLCQIGWNQHIRMVGSLWILFTFSHIRNRSSMDDGIDIRFANHAFDVV